MKNFVLIFTLVFSAVGFAQSNSVIITGKSNISTFKCVNGSYNASLQFVANKTPGIALNIDDFNCGNRLMTAEFRKTLNSEKNPKINVRFLKFNKNSENQFLSTIEVTIANKTKVYEVNFIKNGHIIIGNKKVKFSDFDLVPPRKFGGTVVVKDDLDISLSFIYKD